jgi:hypothetical protein
MMKRVFVLVLLAVFALSGCDGGNDSNNENKTDVVVPGDDIQEDVCYSVVTNTTNDGESACGIFVCEANQYCSTADICDPGCLSELDCAAGQFCDLSNANSTFEGQDIGLCRMPDASLEVACKPNNNNNNNDPCDNVEGSYNVKLSAVGSAEQCATFFKDSVECNVMQETCTITWGCGEGGIFESGDLDDNNSYTFDVAQMGGAGSCTVTFSTSVVPTMFNWTCSGSGGDTVLTCKGTGTQ